MTPIENINHTNKLQYNGLPNIEQASAVHYKLTEDRELQVLRNTVIQDDGSRSLSQDLKKEVHISKQYFTNCVEFIEMLIKFKSPWDVHPGRGSEPKHSNKLLGESKSTVRSVQYRAGSKTRKFETVNIEKMPFETVIDSVKTEWAAAMVFDPKKDGTLRFCDDYRKLNDISKRGTYLILRMEECIDYLRTRKQIITKPLSLTSQTMSVHPRTVCVT